jgi:hypothetical protein
MKRKGLKPRIRFGFDRPGQREGLRRVMPFRRSWVAIAVLAAFDLTFLILAALAFRQAAVEWSSFNGLFDLVAALFVSAWLLGWLTAPLVMTGILVLMLFGREVIKVRPGEVEIFFGLPLLGMKAIYATSRIRNLRFERPLPKSGKSWRGSHLVFDYGANPVAVGSDISGDEVIELKHRIEAVSGDKIRRGEALDEELEGKWVSEADLSTLTDNQQTVEDALAIRTPVTMTSPSIVMLIIANLVPIAGTIFLGWKLSDVMVIYWAESAVIGLFNICKIAVIGRWLALLAGPFFFGHFGGFMAVHFLFIYVIFIQGMESSVSVDDLSKVGLLFISLWPALAALLASHAWSFFSNFLGRNEHLGRTVQDQMMEPYSRIIFMHLVLIFGGGLTLALGGPTPVLLAVIVLKIWFDAKAHLKQRNSHFD